jgi:hypothetical protein
MPTPTHLPMSLGNMRAYGVRSVLAYCSNVNCRHESIVNVDSLNDGVSVPSLGPRLRCQRHGQRGADVRPNWNERAPPTLFGPGRN